LVSRKPVELWSNLAFDQVSKAWQVVQFAAANAVPADGCTGFVVFCQSAKWQDEQAVESPR
jgi:hypothetical protein